MGDGDLDAAFDRLFAVTPDEFVAERTRLAKGLRADGDRPGAAEVAKLTRPSAPAWALNQVAREEPGVVDAWLDAAAALRDASSRPAGVGGGPGRARMAVHPASGPPPGRTPPAWGRPPRSAPGRRSGRCRSRCWTASAGCCRRRLATRRSR